LLRLIHVKDPFGEIGSFLREFSGPILPANPTLSHPSFDPVFAMPPSDFQMWNTDFFTQTPQTGLISNNSLGAPDPIPELTPVIKEPISACMNTSNSLTLPLVTSENMNTLVPVTATKLANTSTEKENIAPQPDSPDSQLAGAAQKSQRGRIIKPSTHTAIMNRIGSSMGSLPLSDVNAATPLDPNAEPEWFIDARQHLQDDFSEEWIACVKAWVELEKGLGYGYNKKVCH
jgi:hypothetical protein